MKRIQYIVITLAFVITALVALVNFLPTSAHVVSNCHYLIGGTAHQPCAYKPTEYKLSFTVVDGGRAYQSNLVTVPAGNWSLKYECINPGAGYPDQFDVSYLWYGYQLPLITHAHLVCDGQWHSESFHFNFQYPVQVMTSRPVFAQVVF